jgi:hypothetical protein
VIRNVPTSLYKGKKVDELYERALSQLKLDNGACGDCLKKKEKTDPDGTRTLSFAQISASSASGPCLLQFQK